MKKGFATSAILYTMLLLFLILMVGILNNLQNKKSILDQLKIETIEAIGSNPVCSDLQQELDQLKSELASGKQLLVEAFHNKGVQANESDSFELMADYIRSFNSEYTIGTFHVAKETSGSIAWDGTQSKKIEATYTPTKDCMFMCYAHSSQDEKYMTGVTSNMPGTRMIQADGIYVNIGMAKAGEPITCDYYAKTTSSYATLYVEIHTNE